MAIPLIEKLRSRHELDVPTSGFRTSGALLTILGGLAVVFLLAPLGAIVLQGFLAHRIPGALALVAGVGSALLALGLATFLVRQYRAAP